MAEKINVAVVGAKTAVGELIIEFLEQRKFPVDQLFPVASEDEAGGRVEFRNKHLRIEEISQFDFSKVQIAFFTDQTSVSETYVPVAAEAGCIAIDRSSCFRNDADVPLVVPEVNAADIVAYSKRNIIASPSCSSIMLAMVLKQIDERVFVSRLNVTTMQAVSGAGKAGLEELGRQTAALLNFQDLKKEVFSEQIAFNVIPQIGELEQSGYSREEDKIINEMQRLLGNHNLEVNPMCVRVPVFYGHSASVNIETEHHINLDDVKSCLQMTPGIQVLDDNVPTPVSNAAGQDDVLVGRLHVDPSRKNSLNMWILTDNLRKGGALNGVQIAEILVKDYL